MNTNISIHPRKRSAATKLRKKRNNERNRRVRAELYNEYAVMGSSRHQASASKWHTMLDALSKGTV